jgi:hypothetical protein
MKFTRTMMSDPASTRRPQLDGRTLGAAFFVAALVAAPLFVPQFWVTLLNYI